MSRKQVLGAARSRLSPSCRPFSNALVSPYPFPSLSTSTSPPLPLITHTNHLSYRSYIHLSFFHSHTYIHTSIHTFLFHTHIYTSILSSSPAPSLSHIHTETHTCMNQPRRFLSCSLSLLSLIGEDSLRLVLALRHNQNHLACKHSDLNLKSITT